jgi:hypothetical protein
VDSDHTFRTVSDKTPTPYQQNSWHLSFSPSSKPDLLCLVFICVRFYLCTSLPEQLSLESTTCPEETGDLARNSLRHVMPDSSPQATEVPSSESSPPCKPANALPPRASEVPLRSGADAPQNTPNALASAQDLPIPERLPAVTAAATQGVGEPTSGLKHCPSSSSSFQAPQEVRVRAPQTSVMICTVL